MAGIINCYNNYCVANNEREISHCVKPLTKITECPEAIVLGDQDDKPRQYYIRVLVLPQCICGREKGRGKAVCYWCYDKLPAYLKIALNKKIGDGFCNGYEQVKRFLKEVE